MREHVASLPSHYWDRRRPGCVYSCICYRYVHVYLRHSTVPHGVSDFRTGSVEEYPNPRTQSCYASGRKGGSRPGWKLQSSAGQRSVFCYLSPVCQRWCAGYSADYVHVRTRGEHPLMIWRSTLMASYGVAAKGSRDLKISLAARTRSCRRRA